MVLSDVEWLDEDVSDGVVERSFRVDRSGRLVPGVLWLPPSGSAPAPLVLLGHGGSGHRRSVRVVEDARWFTAHAGLAAVAIDGPYHGERMPAPLPAARYQARIAEEGIGVVLDRMTDDWRSTVDAVGAAGAVDPGRHLRDVRTLPGAPGAA